MPKSKSYKKFNSFSSAAFFFLTPALGSIFVFFFIPVIAAFAMSFTDFDIYSLGDWTKARFIGIKNYVNLFEDPLFWTSLKNTFYYVIAATPVLDRRFHGCSDPAEFKVNRAERNIQIDIFHSSNYNACSSSYCMEIHLSSWIRNFKLHF